jgi:hypothetical protein
VEEERVVQKKKELPARELIENAQAAALSC